MIVVGEKYLIAFQKLVFVPLSLSNHKLLIRCSDFRRLSICVGNITVYGPIRMLQCRLPSKLCNTDLIGPYADKCEAY